MFRTAGSLTSKQEQLSRYRRMLENTALRLPDSGLQLRQKVLALEAQIAQMADLAPQSGATSSADWIAQDTELLGVPGRVSVGSGESGGGRAIPGGGAGWGGAALGGGVGDGAGLTGNRSNLGGGQAAFGGGLRGAAAVGGQGLGAERVAVGSMSKQPRHVQPPPPSNSVDRPRDVHPAGQLNAVKAEPGVGESSRPELAPQLRAVKLEPGTRESIPQQVPSQGVPPFAPGNRGGQPSQPAAGVPKGGLGARVSTSAGMEFPRGSGVGRSGAGLGATAGQAKMSTASLSTMSVHAAPTARLAAAIITPFPDAQQPASQVLPPPPPPITTTTTSIFG